MEGIPEKYDNSFKDHLRDGTFKYANEYSLRKRLNIIEEQYGGILSVLPVNFSEKISPIVDARNDLTHPETEEDEPETSDLIHYSDILEVVLEVVLLKEVELSDEHVKRKIQVRYEDRLNSTQLY